MSKSVPEPTITILIPITTYLHSGKLFVNTQKVIVEMNKQGSGPQKTYLI